MRNATRCAYARSKTNWEGGGEKLKANKPFRYKYIVEDNWRNLYFFTMLKRSSEKLKRLNNIYSYNLLTTNGEEKEKEEEGE